MFFKLRTLTSVASSEFFPIMNGQWILSNPFLHLLCDHVLLSFIEILWCSSLQSVQKQTMSQIWLTGNSVLIPVLYNWWEKFQKGMYQSLSNEYFKGVAGLMSGIKFVLYTLIFLNQFIIHIYLCSIYDFEKIMPIRDKAEL